MSDALSTTAVLIGVVVSGITGWQIDGYIGVLVAAFILYTGFTTAKDTLNLLLGQLPDREFVQGIEEMVLSHQEIIGVHDLVVHNYGPGPVSYTHLIPMGMGSLSDSFAVMYKRFGESIIPQYTENVAKIHGLWGRKGALQPGFDADVAIFDPQAEPERPGTVSYTHLRRPF